MNTKCYFPKNKASNGLRKIKKNISAFLVLLAAFGGSPLLAATFNGQVVKVIDGDTLEVLHDGRAERVRLAQIDAPERDQPFGQAAKRYLLNTAARKFVSVQVETVDRYGRSVGEIFLPDGTNLNKRLVRAGYAWQYKRYSKDPSYAELEKEARLSGAGLWQDKEPIPPWEWRKQSKEKSEGARFSEDFKCEQKTSCGEINSCEEAYFFLKKCGQVKLDRDQDGVPCEALCR